MRWSTVVLHVLWSYKVINVSCIKGDSIANRENNHWGIWKSLLAKITEGDRISTNFSKISSQSLSCKSQTFLPKERQKQLLLSPTILVIATGFLERLPKTMSEISSDLPKVSFRLEKDVPISVHFFPDPVGKWVAQMWDALFPSITSEYSLPLSQKHGQPLIDGWNRTCVSWERWKGQTGRRGRRSGADTKCNSKTSCVTLALV